MREKPYWHLGKTSWLLQLEKDATQNWRPRQHREIWPGFLKVAQQSVGRGHLSEPHEEPFLVGGCRIHNQRCKAEQPQNALSTSFYRSLWNTKCQEKHDLWPWRDHLEPRQKAFGSSRWKAAVPGSAPQLQLHSAKHWPSPARRWSRRRQPRHEPPHRNGVSQVRGWK